jgi:FkbM family methyltransferase
MTLISYAQNFEDVLLWRCLKNITEGFYIDVGASHPDNESVTRMFYDAGWRGINIEPNPEDFNRLKAARTRDINLAVAVGEVAGRERLFVVPGTGLSTLSEPIASRHVTAGAGLHEALVDVQTLAEVCREHAPSTIHFLKIDVEGSEASVVASADFVAFRPQIILIEAIDPITARETHQEWEHMLVVAEYQFAWFDGLNRFYIARECWDQYSPFFTTPPNVFDDFLRVSDTSWARRIHQAETKAEELQRRVTAVERNAREAARLAIQAQQVEAARFRTLIAEANLRAHEASQWLQSTRSSTSWRLTAPLRRAVRIAGAIRGVRQPADEVEIAPVDPTFDPANVEHSTVHEAAVHIQMTHSARAKRSQPIDAVHQFHSGSAAGDAITNAMLLTRDLLRNLGYISDIFVEHVDPTLADQIRPMEELPTHADYVLILRHSMGYDALGTILKLPAAKILIYHNITPSSLLTGLPVLQKYSRLGRQQLASLIPHVVATLGDSDYNVIELNNVGFSNARTCSLLFNINDIFERHNSTLVEDRFSKSDTFTIIFVGRIIESKGQYELIQAYLQFCKMYHQPSRLVLVGRQDGASAEYASKLENIIESSGLKAQIVLTGLVSDAERDAWYHAADIYVSLSQHEGFGIPLIEAMAFSVPVLAWPAGAIPYILNNSAQVLRSRDGDVVASAIMTLAVDPSARAEIVLRQRETIERFAIDRHLPVLIRALANAGAAPTVDRRMAKDIDKNMVFTITGHVNKTYSLAAVNRQIASEIESHRPGQIRLVPVETRPTEDLNEVPDEELQEIKSLVVRAPTATAPHVVISHHYPVFVPEVRGDCLLALFFWEEGVVPEETVKVLNESFDGVLAPTRYVAKVLVDSGVSVPISVIGPLPIAKRYRHGTDRQATTRGRGDKFTFLHVSSCFPRKGVDVLLKAFSEVFTSKDAVRLVVKGFPNPHNDIAERIAELEISKTDLPEIEFINQDVSSEDLQRLYETADTVVLPTRGEGYNLPAAETIAAGIPLIVTGFGGHMDFCNPGNARLLKYRFERSASHLGTAGSTWVEPDADDLKEALQEAYRRSGSENLRPVSSVHSEPDISLPDRLAKAAVKNILMPKLAQPRIAWISSWNVKCGIAEYSRHLLESFPIREPASPIVILCETRTETTETGIDNIDARPAWQIGSVESMSGLAREVAIVDPHVIIIQHQPGLMHWDMLTTLLNDSRVRRSSIVVVLHNTRHLLDVSPDVRDMVIAALGKISRVIVHTVIDLNRLKDLGLVLNVTMLSHGAIPVADALVPRELSRSDKAIIGCYGFFLPGKGIRELIAALPILQENWPNIRLRLVNAEYDSPDSSAEIEACRKAAIFAGADTSIEWHTSFLPAHRSQELLSECDLLALPYRPSKEASSAALRTAMMAGTPLIVTPISLFEEAECAVARFEGLEPADIARGIGEILDDTDRRSLMQRRATKWLFERRWGYVGAQLSGMLKGLAESARNSPFE